MRPVVLAVDAGGTSTRAAVVSFEGDVLSVARSGPGNPVSAGRDLAVRHVAEACRLAVSGASRRPDAEEPVADVVSAMVTMAGVMSIRAEQPALAAALHEAGLPASIGFESDVLSAWFAGTPADDGTVLVVGTGAVAARVRDGQLDRLGDGLGWLLGDLGSGYWLGHRAAVAAAEHLDARGPATPLTDEVLAVLGLGTSRVVEFSRPAALTQLLGEVYHRRPVQLAELAPLVLQHAADDPVSAGLVDEAADLLATTVSALEDHEDRGDSAGGDGALLPAEHPLVLAGGLLGGGSVLRGALLRRLGARVCLTASDGLAGAAMLALRRAGTRPDDTVHRRLVTGFGRIGAASA